MTNSPKRLRLVSTVIAMTATISTLAACSTSGSGAAAPSASGTSGAKTVYAFWDP